MKFIKDTLVTFKASRVNSLYLLQGYTLDLSGKVSIAQYLDSRMLWNRILRHVSDKDLSELYKKGVFGSEPL